MQGFISTQQPPPAIVDWLSYLVELSNLQLTQAGMSQATGPPKSAKTHTLCIMRCKNFYNFFRRVARKWLFYYIRVP